MNQVEVKECARRIQILTEAYSGLLECKKAAVEIPECHQYQILEENLKKIIAAEGLLFDRLIKTGEKLLTWFILYLFAKHWE